MPRVAPEGAVAVTDFQPVRCLHLLALTVALLLAGAAGAGVLPEDRADFLYHGYDGDGLEVGGPSVLIRKGFANKVSVWANHYVDQITSASVDVVANASQYNEKREERSVGLDFLHGKTNIGIGWTNSEETDYSATNYRIAISQDFFGDLTNVAIAYSRGTDEVRRTNDDNFAEETERQGFRVDISQILTKNLLVSVNYEGVTDEGFLNNPYRQVRYLDPSEARGFGWQPEIYPRTKTSSAAAIRGMYYLPYRAALKGEYRYYSDSWGVEASNYELGYTHPLSKGFTVEARYRFYSQTAADFYSDIFPRENFQNFMARDKELSTFQTQTFGLGVSYEFPLDWMPFLTKAETSLFVDYIDLAYDDFRNVNEANGAAPGEEPLFGFGATVVRAYISLFY